MWHFYRNALTRAIGIRGGGDKPEIRRHRLVDGDRLMLCTDGLTEPVSDDAGDDLHGTVHGVPPMSGVVTAHSRRA